MYLCKAESSHNLMMLTLLVEYGQAARERHRFNILNIALYIVVKSEYLIHNLSLD
jgi:hypothetical protein